MKKYLLIMVCLCMSLIATAQHHKHKNKGKYKTEQHVLYIDSIMLDNQVFDFGFSRHDKVLKKCFYKETESHLVPIHNKSLTRPVLSSGADYRKVEEMIQVTNSYFAKKYELDEIYSQNIYVDLEDMYANCKDTIRSYLQKSNHGKNPLMLNQYILTNQARVDSLSALYKNTKFATTSRHGGFIQLGLVHSIEPNNKQRYLSHYTNAFLLEAGFRINRFLLQGGFSCYGKVSIEEDINDKFYEGRNVLYTTYGLDVGYLFLDAPRFRVGVLSGLKLIHFSDDAGVDENGEDVYDDYVRAGIHAELFLDYNYYTRFKKNYVVYNANVEHSKYIRTSLELCSYSLLNAQTRQYLNLKIALGINNTDNELRPVRN